MPNLLLWAFIYELNIAPPGELFVVQNSFIDTGYIALNDGSGFLLATE